MDEDQVVVETVDENVTTILAQEMRRCRLLEAGDIESLGMLLDTGLVHIHAVGQVDDKDSYLRGLRERVEVKHVSRPDPKVWVNNDLAILTGPLTNTVRLRGAAEWTTTTSYVTQIWQATDDGWKMRVYQATRMVDGQTSPASNAAPKS